MQGKKDSEEFRKFCDNNTIIDGTYNKAFISYKESMKHKSLLDYN